MIDVLDRKTPPESGDFGVVQLPEVTTLPLANGVTLVGINAGTQEVVRIEWVFDAGTYTQEQPLVSFICNQMLNEGTSKLSALQIAERVDYYGAFLQTDFDKDSASIVLYSMKKHLEHVLPLVKEVLLDSVFPEKELEVLLANAQRKFALNMEKGGYRARKRFTEVLFGSHPYGITSNAADYDNITREVIQRFYKARYTLNGCTIIVAGRVDDAVLQLVQKTFETVDAPLAPPVLKENNIEPHPTLKHFLPKADALQSAIRIGRPLFTRSDPDFPGMVLLTTVLGGYFGSRLMANIREDKGYTYGVGAAMVSLKHAGFMVISTEVKGDASEDALHEIYKEIALLRSKRVSEEELMLVKNYMRGSFLKNMDGPFALAERYRDANLSGNDLGYYLTYMEALQNTTSSQLLELANKYLTPESLYEVVVGAEK